MWERGVNPIWDIVPNFSVQIYWLTYSLTDYHTKLTNIYYILLIYFPILPSSTSTQLNSTQLKSIEVEIALIPISPATHPPATRKSLYLSR